MILKFLIIGWQNFCKICPAFLILFFISLMSVSFNVESYVKFNNKPIEGWSSILERADVERFYRVQKGDTLYGISKTFFGDPNFWPKIWSINSNLTNPHIIEKGNIIYFRGGTIFLPPLFGIDSVKSQNYTYGSGLLEPLIPPKPLKDIEPISKKIFPNYFQPNGLRKNEHNKLGLISTRKRQAQFAQRKVMITSEVALEKPLSLGKIKRIQGGGLFAKKGILVLVSLDRKNLDVAPLKEFTVFRYTREGLPLKNKKMKASLVEWLGTVKILSHNKGEEYLAKIIQANDFISRGDFLSNEKIQTLTLPNRIEKIKSEALNSIVEIIGANKSKDLNIIGEGGIVYFNGGSKGGILEGAIYPVFQNFGANFFKTTRLKYFPKNIGYVKIAKTNKHYSTGVVFNLSDEVSTGSRLGVAKY